MMFRYFDWIRYLFCNFKHEQNAVHMADGYARALNDPNVAGVCIAQNGPGITNFVTGK